MKGLTDKQKGVLSLVEDHWRSHGAAPSVSEVADRLDVSKPTAHSHLLALKKKGFLVHDEGKGRTWRPKSVALPYRVERIPLVGLIAAGTPALAQEHIEGWIPVDVRPGQAVLFGLRVQGESMIDAGILDGDVVIVRQQQTAEPGEIIVALVDDEDATVKRLRRRGPTVVLEPENETMAPIEVEASRVRIQGKVIGLRREIG